MKVFKLVKSKSSTLDILHILKQCGVPSLFFVSKLPLFVIYKSRLLKYVYTCNFCKFPFVIITIHGFQHACFTRQTVSCCDVTPCHADPECLVHSSHLKNLLQKFFEVPIIFVWWNWFHNDIFNQLGGFWKGGRKIVPSRSIKSKIFSPFW